MKRAISNQMQIFKFIQCKKFLPKRCKITLNNFLLNQTLADIVNNILCELRLCKSIEA